jgi:hypothetical protein
MFFSYAPNYWLDILFRDTEIVLIPIAATSKMKLKKVWSQSFRYLWAQSDISLNNYSRILFSLDMVLVYHLAHRRNDVKKNGTEYFSRENMLIILFF